MFSKGIWKANWKRFWIVPMLASMVLFLGITFQMMLETQEIPKRERNSPYINHVVVPQTSQGEIIETVNRIENQVEASIEVDSATDIHTTVIKQDEGRYLKNILYSAINVMLIFTVPMVIAILLFCYMNEEKSSSFIHGLPISKQRIYITNIFTGITMYLLPYILNLIILLIFHLGNMGQYIPTMELWKWFGINALYSTIFFSFSVLVGMICASKISHGILTYVFMYAPIGLFVFLTRMLEEIIFGFYACSTQIEELAFNIPFVKILQDFSQIRYYYSDANMEMEGKTVFIYFVVSILMLVVGCFLYQKRKLEITKEWIAFKAARSLIKYVGTLGINLLSYAYFYYVFDENKIASMIASLILTFIGYTIIEMILKKTYRVIYAWKGFAFYATIVIILYVIGTNGALGYETRIPKIEEIKEIAITRNEETICFDEPENRKQMRNLHEKIVTDRNKGYHTIILQYRLTDGRKLSRKYEIDATTYQKELTTLYESDEYLEEVWKQMEDITKVGNIELMVKYKTVNNRYQYKEITIQEEDKKECLKALKQDIQAKKAIVESNYGVAPIRSIKGEKIVGLSVRIYRKDMPTRWIRYTDVEKIGIEKYIQ